MPCGDVVCKFEIYLYVYRCKYYVVVGQAKTNMLERITESVDIFYSSFIHLLFYNKEDARLRAGLSLSVINLYLIHHVDRLI